VYPPHAPAKDKRGSMLEAVPQERADYMKIDSSDFAADEKTLIKKLHASRMRKGDHLYEAVLISGGVRETRI
jgi:hypothetical protein